MIDPDKLLSELSEAARRETAPTLDVRMRVMESISAQKQTLRPDVTPFAFVGVAAALAVCVAIAFLPAWQTMSEPWVCYLPQ